MADKGNINIANTFTANDTSVITVFNENGVPKEFSSNLSLVYFDGTSIVTLPTSTYTSNLTLTGGLQLGNMEFNVGTSFIISSSGDITIQSTSLSLPEFSVGTTLTVNSSDVDTSATSTIETGGTIRSFNTGYLLNSVFLNQSDLGLADPTLIPGTFTTIVTYIYQPIDTNSTIVVMCDFDYSINTAVESLEIYNSRIQVDSTIIQNKEQWFYNQNGGGTRSCTIFPCMGSYQNTGSTPLTIEILVDKTPSTSAIAEILPNNNATLIIQEYKN